MAMFTDQFRQVLRRLGRAPLFTAITLLTLAIGVGANTVIFSVIEGVLLKPLPYPHPEQLIGVWHTALGINIKDLNMSPSIYFIDREQNTTLQDIGVYDSDSFDVTGAGEPEHVRGLDVTDGTLPLLGVVPAVGRLFTRSDDSPGARQPFCFPTGTGRRSSAATARLSAARSPSTASRARSSACSLRDFTSSIGRMPRSSRPSNGTAAR